MGFARSGSSAYGELKRKKNRQILKEVSSFSRPNHKIISSILIKLC